MLYMIFYYGWEPVLIQRISIGFQAILEKVTIAVITTMFMNIIVLVSLLDLYPYVQPSWVHWAYLFVPLPGNNSSYKVAALY